MNRIGGRAQVLCSMMGFPGREWSSEGLSHVIDSLMLAAVIERDDMLAT